MNLEVLKANVVGQIQHLDRSDRLKVLDEVRTDLLDEMAWRRGLSGPRTSGEIRAGEEEE